MSVTHVAGVIVIVAGGRCIQRCAVCGERLFDSFGVKDHTPHCQCRPWPVGSLIRFDGEDRSAVPPVFDYEHPSGRLPDDNCMVLVEN